MKIYQLLITIILCFIFPQTANAFTPTSFSPSDGASGISGSSNFQITFASNACGIGSQSLMIKRSDNNSTIYSIPGSSAEVTGSGNNTITVNPYITLSKDTSYYINIQSGFVLNCSTPMDFYMGINDSTTWNFSVGSDGACGDSINSPCLSPADNSNGVNLGTDLVLTFHRNVDVYPVAMAHIKKFSDNSTVETISLFNGSAIYDGRITINPSSILEPNTHYYITVNGGGGVYASTDITQLYAGMLSNGSWDFTTGSCAADYTCCGTTCGGPRVQDPIFTPLNNANGVSLTSNLTMLFNAEVLHINDPTLTFAIRKTSDDSSVETIALNSPKITISNGNYIGGADLDTRIIVNPTTTLDASTGYYIDISCQAFKNLNNEYFGLASTYHSGEIDGTTLWNFTTAGSSDTTAPTVLHYSPANTAAMIARYQGLNLIFSEAIVKVSGTIYLKRYSDDATVYSIDISSPTVVVNGSSLTIKAPSLLNAGFRFYVELPAGIVEDNAGNDFAGISNKDTWNFTTTQDNSLYNSY